MKRHLKGINAAIAVLALTAGVVITSCGTEDAGTNGPSEEYFPISVGQRWVYDTYNLTRDPDMKNPFYTHVSVENVPAGPGGVVEPIFVTKYAKNAAGEWLRLDQADYWVNKDIFYKYEYFNYSADGRFILRGYNYMSEYFDPVIGTYFYDTNGRRAPFTLFKTPLVLNEQWDVLKFENKIPANPPTTYYNVDQKDYFNLARDMDGDGFVDTMDISIIAKVTGSALIYTEQGSLNCHVVELTQTLIFNFTFLPPETDISTTTYWVAPNHGVAKVSWYRDSDFLDNVEMRLRTWWFVK
jgi:hypothetical protein